MASTDLAVLTEGLRKRYGDKTALDGCDLAVRAGTVHGVLGPNGAGKTTAVRVLSTLLRPDGGTARVAGLDVVRQAAEVRRVIGLVGQHAAVDEQLSGRQNLEMFGRLYHLGARAARARAGELLERFRLADTGRKPVSQYSGGMRRRLDLAAGLILAPRVLFLDEPTTGLDPRSRNEVWEAVTELRQGGATVLLTTQYLEEADRLADDVSVIDDGKVVARGTPAELKSRVGADRVDVVVRRAADLPAAAAALARVAGAGPDVDPETRTAGAPVRDRITALSELLRTLDAEGVEVEDVELRRPTLDEVFLALTGHAAGKAARGGATGVAGAAPAGGGRTAGRGAPGGSDEKEARV
ncbi:ATP-binding cassette domain-containing protein [Bailinhaonella thermotolerans]|uniref:ATP-binding cassette domain-containing protein n=1 Tax=Bailinhaonella thermotolerans TaxID=1070861 RepID=A0A3A4AZ27_9ACTN|nr:ATP-binding cassette domain-containing protein [Bailinhaonella thermotolerans]RJL34373.1 ATP-binding cassette domain-containing protein [Bailinhaonella thermotolerans]